MHAVHCLIGYLTGHIRVIHASICKESQKIGLEGLDSGYAGECDVASVTILSEGSIRAKSVIVHMKKVPRGRTPSTRRH